MISVKEHFHTPLPWVSLFFGVVWSVVHHRFAEVVIRIILPHSGYKKLEEKRRLNDRLNRNCLANTTALIHSAVVSPIALLCVMTDPWLRRDPINGQSPLFDISMWIMCGYFLWDIQCCLKNIDSYGLTFVIHGLLSFIGLYAQAASVRSRFPWYTAAFMASEMSTPFLHTRWLLVKAGETKSFYFKLVNFFFVISFVGYRLLAVQYIAVIPWLTSCWIHRSFGMSMTRKLILTSAMILWTALNVQWTVQLARSQIKQWTKGPSGVQAASSPPYSTGSD